MSHILNGIEVLQWANDNLSYKVLPAAVSSTWGQGDLLYWDTTANEVKKYAPADTTAGGALQASLIGIAQAGKKSGETTAIVALKAVILATVTGTVWAGCKMVPLYNTTTLKYSFQEDSAYDAAYEPDLSLSGDFAVCAVNEDDADLKCKININGESHFNALSAS